jgi:hypothetical protein
VLWCLSAWSKGACGVLPWQTIGSGNCWREAEQTALFYPLPGGPMPSVRLKAFRRGQQDVEYLTLLSHYGWSGHSVAAWLGEQISLQDSYYRGDTHESLTVGCGGISPMDLWKIRYRIGEFLSEKSPPYRRALVKREQPKWDPKRLPDIGYVSVAPRVDSYRPDCDSFRPSVGGVTQ